MIFAPAGVVDLFIQVCSSHENCVDTSRVTDGSLPEMWPFRNSRRVNSDLDDLASGMIQLALGSSITYENDLRLLDGELKDVDKDVALMELFNLRLFVAVYASQLHLRGEDAKQRFREILIQTVHKLLKGATDSRLRANPNLAIDEINRRLVLYKNAVSVPHHLGPPWNVGKVFCQLCTGKQESAPYLDIVMVGSIEFAGNIRAMVDYLQKCKQGRMSRLINV